MEIRTGYDRREKANANSPHFRLAYPMNVFKWSVDFANGSCTWDEEFQDEKPEWNLQGFEKAKHEASGTCAFYLKRIHRVTSRHQKIRVDENRVGGTCFVRLYSFP